MPGAFRYKSVESLKAVVSMSGQDLTFQLYSRPLSLGDDLTIQYYWMDSSDFRRSRGKQRNLDSRNISSCLTHWWLAVRSKGQSTDPVQLRHFIMATSYGVFSGNKSLQSVYHDAFLAPGTTDSESRSLSDSVRRRIRKMIRAQDPERVRKELNDLLMGPDASRVPENEDLLMRQTWNGFVNHAMDLLQEHGNAGWDLFLGKLEAWCSKHRKKSGHGWIRKFLNVLAYECKICFYRCYANAWIDLICWLRQNRGLDEMSERFLLFWHAQNQPQRTHDGKLIPDVFAGQVLSLHPMSGFFMKDRALCAIAGQFFQCGKYDHVMKSGNATGCKEYWDLIGAILTAAHYYWQAAREQARGRGVRRREGKSVDAFANSSEIISGATIIEEFLAALDISCSQCNAALRCEQFHPEDSNARSFKVDLKCSQCNDENSRDVDRAEFENWVRSK